MILEDTFILEEMEVVTETRNGQVCKKLRGVFQRADEANNNKRVYPKALLEREVKKLTEALSERRLMGELDHPKHDSVKLSNVSHLITNLHIKDNDVIGECELLNTPAGKVAQALVEGGVKIGISSRGMGTLSEGENGLKNVNEDFKLVTFDLVADPSTRGAFPTIAESKQSVLVENIVKDTLDTAAREKVFTTLLKQKLTEKTAKKGKKKDPLSIWRGDANFGHNNSTPRKAAKHRTYDNAEEPTETMKVSETEIEDAEFSNKKPGLFSRLKAMLPKRRGSGNRLLQGTLVPKGMSQDAWEATKKRSISSMKGPDPRGPQNSSTEYALVRSALDQKLNEEEKKKSFKLGTREILALMGGNSARAEKLRDKRVASEEAAKKGKKKKEKKKEFHIPERTPTNPGTGKTPPGFRSGVIK